MKIEYIHHGDIVDFDDLEPGTAFEWVGSSYPESESLCMKIDAVCSEVDIGEAEYVTLDDGWLCTVLDHMKTWKCRIVEAKVVVEGVEE